MTKRLLSLAKQTAVRLAAICGAAPFLLLHAGAAAPEDAPLPQGEIVASVPCVAAPGQSYSLFVPRGAVPEKGWPILYAFDAGGRGKMVAELFRPVAEELGYVIASSNNYRSGDVAETTFGTLRAVWEDTHARLPIDPRRVFATGFSGGARGACALALAQRGNVAGVIGVGGGWPVSEKPTGGLPFAFFGLAGMRDFNYTELVKLDATLKDLGVARAFDSFDGEHQWPPAADAARALRWMELRSMKAGVIPVRTDFVAAQYVAFCERARQIESSGDPVAALRRLDGILDEFSGLHDTASAKKEADRIRASAELARAVKEQAEVDREADLFLEQARQNLPALLQTDPRDVNLGKAVAALQIPAWQKKASKGGTTYAGCAAARSLESLYVQAAFYLPQYLIGKKDYRPALLSLDIAAMIMPARADARVSMAEVCALKGDDDAAISALRKAVELGWDDAAALQQDPAFQQLREKDDFRKLIDSIQKKAGQAPQRTP